MIVNTIKPDVAIVTDVTHDTGTPMINKSNREASKMERDSKLYDG